MLDTIWGHLHCPQEEEFEGGTLIREFRFNEQTRTGIFSKGDFIMVHDDVQFSTPFAHPSNPLLEDRTQPFPVHRLEISNDVERRSRLVFHQVKTYSERYMNVAKWLGLLTFAYILNRMVGLFNVPCMLAFFASYILRHT